MRSMLLTLAMMAGSTLAGTGALAQELQEPTRNRPADARRRLEEMTRLRNQFVPGRNPNFLTWTMEGPEDPTLGATLVPVPDRLRSHLQIPEGRGLVVTVIEPDGAAARAGLHTNDILLSLDDKNLAKPEDLDASLKDADDSATLELKILRGGKPVTLKVRRVVAITLGPAEDPRRSDYVLGVAVSVPDDALRAHLDLPDDRGLLVDQVVKGSAAEKGGIKQNDVILSIAGKPLEGTEALINQVREGKDKPTELLLLREGKELTLVVTAEKRPMKDRAISAREPFRMFMFDPSNTHAAPTPGMPPMNMPGMRMQPFNQGVPNARVEQLERELKSLRESIDELRDAVKASKKPRDDH